ncbi:pentatricopeptide repeat-containing protein [Tanacetum coccineum]
MRGEEKGADHNSDHGLRAVRCSRRFGWRRLLFWLFSFAAICSIYIAAFGFKMFFHGVEEHQSIPTLTSVKEILTSVEDVPVEPEIIEPPKKKPPRGLELTDSVDEFVEPNAFGNFVKFSLNYIAREDISSLELPITPRFGGHQTLEERERSFHAANQTIHCGFVEGSEGSPSTGFDLDKGDKMYMNTCTVVVSSCIFGSSDFLEGQLAKWIVVVSNLPYEDMRKTGKVPKFLSHRLFPSARPAYLRYSIWLDSKLRLHTDPMMLIEYFLWRRRSEYAISNHYTHHCVWDEADGLVKFDPSDLKIPFPSCAYRWIVSAEQSQSYFIIEIPESRPFLLVFVALCCEALQDSNSTLKNHISHPHCEALKRVAESGQSSMSRDGDFVTHLQTMEFATFDVLSFWKAKETMFLVLSRMAMDILSVQATSVASESAFSISGRVLSIRRTRLTPASLEMCMCLKDHLDAQERKQDKSTLETLVDFKEEILDAEVQENEAIPLSDEEITLDAASSKDSMSEPGSGGEEAADYGYDVYHDDY